jgi:amino acid transporter
MSDNNSPIKVKPIHVAGQSLEYMVEDTIADMASYLLIIAGILIMVIIEWLRWIFPLKIPPILISIIGAIAIGYCVYKIIKFRKQLMNYRLGIDGERLVAEKIDTLKSEGYIILHDIVANKFNIDHVIISKKGIFTIETKTLRKRGKEEITFKNGNIFAGNRNLGKDSINQSIAESAWLINKIYEITGKKHKVKPILIFPNWYIQRMDNEMKKLIWILNQNSIISFLTNEKEKLDEKEIQLITFGLISYIRVQK